MDKLRSLEIVKVIRHKSRQWNQTNYYSLDCDLLLEFIGRKSAGSTEKSELCVSTDRDVNNQQIEVRDNKLSFYRTKNTNQKNTAENKETNLERSQSVNSNSIAAASSSLKNALEKEIQSKEVNTSFAGLNGLQALNKARSGLSQKVVREESKFRNCSINVTKIVNPKWKSLVEELDGVGVQINKTLVSLVKMYSEEEVRKAIALIKIRKSEKHIPNLAGYFTAALKGGWSSSNTVVENAEEAIDKATEFRFWYDLSKELGYCTSQEIRDKEQWVLISGNWEKWRDASDRGYSLEYFKKVKARNRGC